MCIEIHFSFVYLQENWFINLNLGISAAFGLDFPVHVWPKEGFLPVGAFDGSKKWYGLTDRKDTRQPRTTYFLNLFFF